MENFRFEMTKVYSRIPPPEVLNPGDRMWRLICTPRGYHSFIWFGVPMRLEETFWLFTIIRSLISWFVNQWQNVGASMWTEFFWRHVNCAQINILWFYLFAWIFLHLVWICTQTTSFILTSAAAADGFLWSSKPSTFNVSCRERKYTKSIITAPPTHPQVLLMSYQTRLNIKSRKTHKQVYFKEN